MYINICHKRWIPVDVCIGAHKNETQKNEQKPAQNDGYIIKFYIKQKIIPWHCVWLLYKRKTSPWLNMMSVCMTVIKIATFT